MVSHEIKSQFKDHLTLYKSDVCPIAAIPVHKKYVHKKLKKNIAIARPVKLSDQGPRFRTRIIVANENDFFFDHDLRHLPGMLIMEAVRQLSIALTHIHFEIPHTDRFLMNELASRFFRLSNKIDPTYLDAVIQKALIRDKTVHYMTGICFVHQNEHLIGAVTGTWCAVTKDVFDKLEDNIREKYPRGVMIDAVH